LGREEPLLVEEETIFSGTADFEFAEEVEPFEGRRGIRRAARELLEGILLTEVVLGEAGKPSAGEADSEGDLKG
jgi:hypothetical protein